MTAFIAPYTRTSWKAVAKAQHAKAHANLRRAVNAERELAEVPKALRIICRVVGRMLRGKG